MELEWPLILFTFFLPLSGGIAAAQGILTCMGKGKNMQFTSLLASLIALVIGGIAVITHLTRPMHILNGFGHITSGITLELIFCIVLGVALVLYFFLMRRSESGVAPKWAAVFMIVAGFALAGITGDSYLMPSRPAWNTILLPLYYMCNVAVFGGLCTMIIASVKEDNESVKFLSKYAFVSLIVQFALIIIYAIYISLTGDQFSDIEYYFDPVLPDHAMASAASLVTGVILTGSMAPVFWICVIAVGIVVPVVLVWLSRNFEAGSKLTKYYAIAVVCVVVGFIAWRCILYVVAASVFALF